MYLLVSPQQQDVLTVNSAVYPSRKHSMPDNLHKPPSPKENDVAVDPLADKPKQSSVSSMSSIKPPSTFQPPFVLQQQQKVMVTQTKPSPPLVNKRSTAIPRKPVATSAKNHTTQSLDSEYHQIDIPTSHSHEELSSVLTSSAASSVDEPMSPLLVTMENQSDRAFSFPRHSSTSQQQVKDSVALICIYVFVCSIRLIIR